MSKTSGSLSILIPILVFTMTILAGAIIWVVLLSPYFGKQLNAPINPVLCEIIHQQEKHPGSGKSLSSPITPHPNHSSVTPPSAEQCYRAEEVLALNKALNMSDTISLLGVLLAVFAFIAPVFSYLTLRTERQYLENLIQGELKKSTDALQNTLKESIATSINPLPLILQSIEEFKSAYQIDAYQRVNRSAAEAQKIAIQSPLPVDRDTSVKNETDALQGMRRSATDACQIASRLLSLLDRDTSASGVFGHIASYITDKVVIENSRHIQMLKMVIRQLYDSSYLGADDRRAALSEFLKETLKMSHEDFINSTSSKNT